MTGISLNSYFHFSFKVFFSITFIEFRSKFILLFKTWTLFSNNDKKRRFPTYSQNYGHRDGEDEEYEEGIFEATLALAPRTVFPLVANHDAVEMRVA